MAARNSTFRILENFSTIIAFQCRLRMGLIKARLASKWINTFTRLRVELVWNVSMVAVFSPIVMVNSASAHEGHRPLPTRGMEVNAETGKMILTKQARDVLDVQTVEVTQQPFAQTIQAYGTLVSPWNQHAVIAPPLAGRIVALKVNPGERVITGQVLAEMDSPELDQLQLELRAAKVDLELSTKLVASTEAASRAGSIPGARFIEAQTKMQQDKAAVEIASSKWRALRLPIANLHAILSNPRQVHPQRLALSSPIDGVVTHADLSVGKFVDPKEHLFEILDLSKVWLKIGVLEKDLSHVAIGQRIDVTVTAIPGKTYVGVIDVIGHYLDPQTHLGTAWATLENSSSTQSQLLPGMSGIVRIHEQEPGEPLTVPLDAVMRDGAERFVLVEEEQTQLASSYQKQPVVLGKRSGSFMEVRGGNLFPGDRVVTRGSHELGSFFAQGVLSVSPEAARDIGLSVQPASIRMIAKTTSIDGVLDIPRTHRSVAAAQHGGTIERILVDRGQQVRRGDLLAEIMSQEFQNLQLDLLKANLNLSLKQTLVENLRTASEAFPQRQLWEAESQLNQFNSRRDTIVQQLRNAGLSDEQLDKLTSNSELINFLPVRSPINGTLVSFEKFLGHVVQPDEPLFEIHDLKQAWVQGFISEQDLPRIQVGQSARIRFVASRDEVILGKLVRSGQAFGSDDRTLSIWIDLQEMPSFPIQHNMLARVTIETGAATSQLAVPRQSVVHEGTSAYIFVEKADKTFERRFVITGKSDDMHVEVLNGLLQGDSIAVQGAAALQTAYAALK